MPMTLYQPHPLSPELVTSIPKTCTLHTQLLMQPASLQDSPTTVPMNAATSEDDDDQPQPSSSEFF